MSNNPFKEYRITSSFGYRIHPISGGQTFHRGIDLVTEPWNGPIHAFMDGTVRFASEGATGSGFGGYGLTVAVQDHRGYLHCYAHLSRIAVKVGQQVKRGQLLGNQGSTGKVRGLMCIMRYAKPAPLRMDTQLVRMVLLIQESICNRNMVQRLKVRRRCQ